MVIALINSQSDGEILLLSSHVEALPVLHRLCACGVELSVESSPSHVNESAVRDLLCSSEMNSLLLNREPLGLVVCPHCHASGMSSCMSSLGIDLSVALLISSLTSPSPLSANVASLSAEIILHSVLVHLSSAVVFDSACFSSLLKLSRISFLAHLINMSPIFS